MQWRKIKKKEESHGHKCHMYLHICAKTITIQTKTYFRRENKALRKCGENKN